MEPLILVTGFGPYEEVRRNPSREIALALEREPPPGVRVRAAELPVSFERCAGALDELIDGCPAPGPDVVLALGLKKHGDCFDLERRARATLRPGRADEDGASATAEGIAHGRDRGTPFDVDGLARVMRAAGGAGVGISDDAGGYVCERLYHHALLRCEELGARGLFLHVPPVEVLDVLDQTRIVRALVLELARSATG